MPSLENFLLFVAASVVLVITPGPNMIYLVSRTLCQGRAAGLVSLAGVQLGFGARTTEYGGVYSSELDTYLAPGRTFWARLSRYF